MLKVLGSGHRRTALEATEEATPEITGPPGGGTGTIGAGVAITSNSSARLNLASNHNHVDLQDHPTIRMGCRWVFTGRRRPHGGRGTGDPVEQFLTRELLYEARLIRDLFDEDQSDVHRLLPGDSTEDVPAFLSAFPST